MKIFLKKNNKSLKNSKNGFTLVELLITIVIFVMLTGVVLFNQNSFDNTILLKNLAYDIALTIRQAQTYGVNVKESQKSGTFSSYGVYFNKEMNNKSFILFADTDKSNSFNSFDPLNMDCIAGDTECVQKFSLKRNSYISEICVGANDGDCIDPNNLTNNLTILFQRPDPDAILSYVDSNDQLITGVFYAKITISSATNSATSSIVVTNPGQIYIKK
jgi:prepilin-type N-terminal cleavage/methylation domain-containing protein